MPNTAKFTTYGPNRGLTLQIGAYQFTDGVCEVPENDASAASSILTRYHDVCYSHELEDKSAEYDAAHKKQPKPAPINNTPPQKPADPTTKTTLTLATKTNADTEKNTAPADEPNPNKTTPAADAAADGDGKQIKNGNGAANGKTPSPPAKS